MHFTQPLLAKAARSSANLSCASRQQRKQHSQPSVSRGDAHQQPLGNCWARAPHPALEEHLRLPAGEEGRIAGGPPLVPAAEARPLPRIRRPEARVLAKVACHARHRRAVMHAPQRAAGARRAMAAGAQMPGTLCGSACSRQ